MLKYNKVAGNIVDNMLYSIQLKLIGKQLKPYSIFIHCISDNMIPSDVCWFTIPMSYTVDKTP